MNRYGSLRDGEAERSTERLTITPYPLRSHAPSSSHSHNPDLIQIQSPDTPHPLGHTRGQSESRQLLPSSHGSNSHPIFQYSATAAVDFRDIDIGGEGNEFPKWDSEPQTLRQSRRERCADLAIDLGIVAMVIPFFALAVAIFAVDGKAPGRNQEKIFRESTFVAATFFPLVFSLVVGRLAVKLAHYKLERGATLGFLERLMGSQSFFRALTTQIRLWPLNLLAILLIIIWLLSPVGSQAILRSLSIDFTSTNSATNVTYFNTRQPSIAADQDSWKFWFPSFATLFTASLLASPDIKTGPLDLWGNIKIPFLSSLINITDPDSEGWYTVPSNTTLSSSSLFGIPISSLSEGTTIFTIESAYISLNCSTISTDQTRNISSLNPKIASDTEVPFFNPGLISPTGPFISSQDITSSTPWALGYLGPSLTPALPTTSNITFSLDNLHQNVTAETLYPGLLLYQDFTGLQNVTSIYCSPSQVYIESEITCSSPSQQNTHNCSVTKQRSSTLPHARSTLTLLSFHELFLALTTLLPLATSPQPTTTQPTNPRIETIDFIQNYLASPLSTTYITTTPSPGSTHSESLFLKLPLEDFSLRLSQVLNTFFQGTLNYSTSFLSESSSPSQPPQPQPQQLNTDNEISNTTTQLRTLPPSIIAPATHHTPPTLTFKLHTPWLTTYLLATSLLLLSALATAILSRLTISPPYLPYVSSLAREAEAVGLPRGGVRSSGMERTRRLAGVGMRFGDVGEGERGGWEVGIGARVGVGRLGVGRVERGGGEKGGWGEGGGVRGVGGRGLYI